MGILDKNENVVVFFHPVTAFKRGPQGGLVLPSVNKVYY